MTHTSDEDSTASRLAQASEALSVLAHELAIAVAETPPETAGAVAGILTSVSERLSRQALAIAEIVFVVAEELAGHLLTRYRRACHAGRSFTSADLAALDEPIQRLLEDNEPLATGAGVAVTPDILADRHLWMQWWVRDGGRATQLLPQLDPGRPRYYDYTKAVWFAEPARDLVPHLAPPHFDEGGTDTFMITATIPTLAGSRMIGLACAEMTLERLAQLVTPALAALSVPAALITPDSWVAASTHPRLRSGELVPGGLLGQSRAGEPALFSEPVPGVTVARSPALAWRLVADWR